MKILKSMGPNIDPWGTPKFHLVEYAAEKMNSLLSRLAQDD